MIRASSILFWFALVIAASVGVYNTSNHVRDLHKQLGELNASIEAEQARIHVLKAEWVYLANPARIEMAARKYLAMKPTALKQIAKLEKLGDVLPRRDEGTALAKATPAAKTASAGYVNTYVRFENDAPIRMANSDLPPNVGTAP